MALDLKRESRLADACFIATLFILAGISYELFEKGQSAYLAGDTHTLKMLALYIVCLSIGIYSNLLNQALNRGFFKRKLAHVEAPIEAIEARFDCDASSLCVLIPAYKEEASVLKRTLLNTALMEYPKKDIVLLIDNPAQPTTIEDIHLLDETRAIPAELQGIFDARREAAEAERAAYFERKNSHDFCAEAELARVAILYDDAAAFLDQWIDDYRAGRRIAELPHEEQFFVGEILGKPAQAHRQRAFALRSQALSREPQSLEAIERDYHRLAGLYAVTFSSFERKRYANFSHEANKAMNLNAYLSLIGGSWGEMEIDGKLHLRETSRERAGLNVARPEYVIIIDADTLLTHDYALRLTHEMEKPEHVKTGLMQSFPSAYPNCPNMIERMAGANIHLGFRTVQGHCHFDSASWMGANAVIRMESLEAIQVVEERDGIEVLVTIPDMTVIEDNEATLALLNAGWKVHQYPERMAYFSSPPDFGSLLIQRRRWANGGILLMPALMRYVRSSEKSLKAFKETIIRIDYMNWAMIQCLTILFFSMISFGKLGNSPWLALLALPQLILQLRMLKSEGYRYSDMIGSMAFNLLLIPVVLGGTLKSIEQAITGVKSPFARTPKVPQRTTAPALYCIIELLFPLFFSGMCAYYAFDGAWSQAIFSGLNAAITVYALIAMLGVKATIEDASFGIRTTAKAAARRLQSLLPSGALGQEA